jgi:conjugal transfer pilus assembly protein TraI
MPYPYLPGDQGLPVVAVAEVIAPHAEWLKRLRYAYGADQATFDRDIGAVVQRYAHYVHLLPATPDRHFHHAGGLFRMGLEIGFYALQATDGAIFSGRQTITQRSTLEPRWRYATFLAGLCSELHRSLSHVIVTNDHGDEWPAYLQPLATWLQQTRSCRYQLRWRPRPEDVRALGVVAVSHIVTPTILHYLAEGNAVVVPHFMASLSGTMLQREANTLDQLVRRAAAVVIDHDLSTHVDLPVEPPQGAPLARSLVAAMRRLVTQRQWILNQESSPLWYAEDGLFLLWPRAASDVVEQLRHEPLPSIPPAPAAMAAMLMGAGVVECTSDGSMLWSIVTGDQMASASALKLASPALLLSAGDDKPLPRPLRQPALAAVVPAVSGAQAQLALPMPEPMPAERADGASSQQPAHLPGVPTLLPLDASGREPATLVAPARLNPTVRDALRQIIATLDSTTVPLAAFVIECGVFVPLQEFARRGVDPALAVRSLSDANLLVADPTHPQSNTCSRTFANEPVLGIALAPQCIRGLDERAFGAPSRQPVLTP